MRIFGSCYECYIPDTQLLYPLVFLHDVSILPFPNTLYKECIDALRKDFNLKILPENSNEFYRLILRKFHRFLDDIKSEALRAKRKGSSITTYDKKVSDLIRSQDYGDFYTYWKEHKHKFGEWLNIDRLMIEEEVNSTVAKMLLKYKECTEGKRQEWTLEDKHVVSILYEALKEQREKGVLSSKVHNEDLRLLAGYLRYVEKYLPEGICYLVTDDANFYNCAEKVPTLKCLTGDSAKRLVGCKVIKPKTFLDELGVYPKKLRRRA